ncbi:MAG: TIGR01777 family oxidoreductase [Chloroflexi bacterium]|nr:TIGR01777 family oxidoreductase [Chloroflexota bacterium]
MRVIITGGTGLIGRALAAELSPAHEVIVLSRQPASAPVLPAGVRAEWWDAKTSSGWVSLLNAECAIINLAGENIGEGRWTAGRKRSIRDSRVNAGRAVVQAVAEAAEKPAVLIQASGVSYYGTHGEEEFDESSPPGDDFLSRVSVDWEASSAAVESMGVRRAVIRSAVVLSMKGGAFPRMLLPFRLHAGGPIGNGRQWLSWIHIRDEVAAIRFLIENGAASGPFNLSAPGALTNAQFARAIGETMRQPAAIPVPAFVLRLLYGEMAAVLLEGQRAVPKRLTKMGFSFRFPDARSALQDLLG